MRILPSRLSLPFAAGLSRLPLPATRQEWQRTLLAVVLALLALYELKQHIYYLNHLDPREWGHRYLYVNRSNQEFVRKLGRLKLLISVCWLASFAFCIWRTQRVLEQRGLTPDRQALGRLSVALPLFLISLVNYDPPDIDLSLYFAANTVCFAMLAAALHMLPNNTQPLEALGRWVMRWRAVPTWVLCAGAFGAVCVSGYFLGAPFFSHLPLTVDTNAQLAHAKMMLDGNWFIKSQPIKEFFNMWMMVNDGRWYSQYPPGHVFMLTIGAYFQKRTFVNPVLGGLTTLAVYYMALQLYGRRVARIAVVLAGSCIYLIVMSSEFMMNATSLLTGTMFLAFYFRMFRKPTWQSGLLAGIAIGYCFITRPYSAVALAMPYIIHSVYLLVVERKTYLRPLIAMALMGGAFLGFQLYYNAATTGDPLVFGYQRSWGDWHNPLSGAATSRLNDFEMEKNFRENLQRLAWFNRVVFEWPLPGLALLTLMYGWRGARRPERLMFLTIVSFAASCQVLPGNVEREWGPRLMYESLTCIILLSAKALALMPAFFRRVLRQPKRLSYYYGFALIMALPLYGVAMQHNMRIDTLMKLYNFYGRGGNPAFYRFIVRNVQSPALVFVEGLGYQAVSFSNPPQNTDRIIFANDLGNYNTKLMQLYPDRYAYRAYIGRNGYVVEPYR
ncbi:MAG: hypothetical protein EBV03_03105 [Proteobacteria bacterium]|nr:hypothetical protein [Pseudomonadota bacterium]